MVNEKISFNLFKNMCCTYYLNSANIIELIFYLLKSKKQTAPLYTFKKRCRFSRSDRRLDDPIAPSTPIDSIIARFKRKKLPDRIA